MVRKKWYEIKIAGVAICAHFSSGHAHVSTFENKVLNALMAERITNFLWSGLSPKVIFHDFLQNATY